MRLRQGEYHHPRIKAYVAINFINCPFCHSMLLYVLLKKAVGFSYDE